MNYINIMPWIQGAQRSPWPIDSLWLLTQPCVPGFSVPPPMYHEIPIDPNRWLEDTKQIGPWRTVPGILSSFMLSKFTQKASEPRFSHRIPFHPAGSRGASLTNNPKLWRDFPSETMKGFGRSNQMCSILCRIHHQMCFYWLHKLYYTILYYLILYHTMLK